MSETGVQNLKARYVFPVLGPPIPDGVVRIVRSQIVAVGKEALPGSVEDLGQVALLPGLINAHTHLDLSLLDRPIGRPGLSFSQWVRLVVERFRRPVVRQSPPSICSDGDQPSVDASQEGIGGPSEAVGFEDQAYLVDSLSSREPPNWTELALQTGLAELIRSGTTAVADIAQPGFTGHLYSQTGMKGIVFLELRGPTRSRVAQALQQAQEHLAAWLAGVSGKPISSGAGSAEVAPISPVEDNYCKSPLSLSLSHRREREKVPLRRPALQAGLSPGKRGDFGQPIEESSSAIITPPTEGATIGFPPPWQLGLSPHAPYTVRPELLEAAVALAKKHRLPLAMHLAESLEEIQFLQTGQGPLRDLLEDLGQWEPGLVQPPLRPLDYLRQLAQADRALIIHGNYLDEEEWAFLAAHRDRMAVVFCPRSHAHFGHRPYPLQQMLSWGVRVILGTDSRASAPEMNMLAELRWAAGRFPDLPPQKILELATLESAQAVGWGEELGALVPGRRADIIAVALPDQPGAADPYELLFHTDLPVVGAWIAGQRVFSTSTDTSSEY